MDLEDIIHIVGTFICVAILLPLLILSLPEVVSEEKVEVDVTITEVRYQGPIITQYVKKMADQDIYFEYDGIKGSWNVDYKTYEQYKDKVGEPIKCYLITRVYDNGKAELKLVAVDDYERRNNK